MRNPLFLVIGFMCIAFVVKAQIPLTKAEIIAKKRYKILQFLIERDSSKVAEEVRYLIQLTEFDPIYEPFFKDERPWIYLFLGDADRMSKLFYGKKPSPKPKPLIPDSPYLSSSLASFLLFRKAESPSIGKRLSNDPETADFIDLFLEMEICERRRIELNKESRFSQYTQILPKDSIVQFKDRHPTSRYWNYIKSKISYKLGRSAHRVDAGFVVPVYLPVGSDFKKISPGIGIGFSLRYCYKNWAASFGGVYASGFHSKGKQEIAGKVYEDKTEFGLNEWRLSLGYNILFLPKWFITPTLGLGWRQYSYWESTANEDKTKKFISANPVFLYGLSVSFIPDRMEEAVCNGLKYDRRNFAIVLSTLVGEPMATSSSFRFERNLQISIGLLIGGRFRQYLPPKDYKDCISYFRY